MSASELAAIKAGLRELAAAWQAEGGTAAEKAAEALALLEGTAAGTITGPSPESPANAWRPGERVELVTGGYGGEPESARPATVVSVDEETARYERLRIRFDDTGEERYVSPEVMRHAAPE